MTAAAAQQLIPKSEWGPGPWQDEPDHLLFWHAGMPCYIFRNMWVTGSLCGYVALFPEHEHPWWGKDYNECVATPPCDPDPPFDWDSMPESFPKPKSERILASMAEPRWSCDHRPEAILDVHGGVTYGGPMQYIGTKKDEMPPTFEWGFGFDTAHAGDLTPLMDATLRLIYLSQPGGKREWAEHQRVMLNGPFRNRYRTIRYVRGHVKRLAEQLAAVRR